MANDKLGKRMKDQYEHRTRHYLPRRTYTIVRVDGKAFHTLTKGFDRPFDLDLMNLMDQAAIALCQHVQGVKFAYVQSDEISLLMTDFDKVNTDAYFDGNIQKITSIIASIATAAFNKHMRLLHEEACYGENETVMHSVENSDWRDIKKKLTNKDGDLKTAYFDSRVFTIPDRTEVENYFIWRQQDATKNSIQMLAQSYFSHREVHGKNTSKLQDMLMLEKGINWNDEDAGFKRGRVITKENYLHKDGKTMRTRWVSDAAEIFTKYDRGFFKVQIPYIGGNYGI